MSITYALKNPVRLGGIVALSGTIIGKPEDWVTRKGSLGATPVYLAWGDRDTYYAVERTERDVKALQERGAEVRSSSRFLRRVGKWGPGGGADDALCMFVF